MSAAEAEVKPTIEEPNHQNGAAPTEPPATGEGTGLNKDSPLGQLASKLGELIESTGYNEIYGVELSSWQEGTDLVIPQQVILQKFLRANAGDVAKATEQLKAALKWRKEFGAPKTKDEVFDKARFDGLGYVTELKDMPGSPNKKDVAVFNIYGAVKDNKKTFGDLDGFIRWRVALMELTIARLDIANAKTPLPDYGKGPDPYQAVQVHDYLSVSFLRQAPEVKAASSKTIQLFQQMYPETTAKKFFVNVPIFMQWMFAAMKMVMAKETVAKMQWTSYGNQLYMDLGPSVPKAYGGSGPDLTAVAETPKYDMPTSLGAAEATKTETPAAETQQPGAGPDMPFDAAAAAAAKPLS
ncbi:Phosphatidylinositol transfer protein SFH5 [Sphaceloma murrayae]|uniref:Phosphatidylinositol transfer protein SFH5 n=1 Tax=Sphaceloma murrayae TaxID=2082308 RepID=A0A2K1QM12_9PEZI|nr:Phosphatidylinositol transfer protein SFH5 [Sphaceloma murrayae]